MSGIIVIIFFRHRRVGKNPAGLLELAAIHCAKCGMKKNIIE